MSVLIALLPVNSISHRVVLWLHKPDPGSLLPQTHFKHFCWVPAQWSIHLNEKVEYLSKRIKDSDFLGTCLKISFTSGNSDQIRILTSIVTQSNNFTLHGDSSCINRTNASHVNRCEDVIVTRLLCKMLITTDIVFVLDYCIMINVTSVNLVPLWDTFSFHVYSISRSVFYVGTDGFKHHLFSLFL